MNRFKGLDLVERVLKELWMKIHNTLQEAVIKTISIKKKCKKAKWLSKEPWQIAEERKEVKSKGKREKYIQLNAELHRIARREKKAFWNEKCKEIEENCRMGTTRHLFKKTGASREHFMQRDITIINITRNGVKKDEKEKKKEITRKNRELLSLILHILCASCRHHSYHSHFSDEKTEVRSVKQLYHQ